jgi:hypothetical protein
MRFHDDAARFLGRLSEGDHDALDRINDMAWLQAAREVAERLAALNEAALDDEACEADEARVLDRHERQASSTTTSRRIR